MVEEKRKKKDGERAGRRWAGRLTNSFEGQSLERRSVFLAWTLKLGHLGALQSKRKKIRAKEKRLGERPVRAGQGRVGEGFCVRKKGGDGLSAIVLNSYGDLTPQL